MKMAFIDVDAALFCFLFYFKEPFFDAVLDRLSSSEDAVGGGLLCLFYLGILPAKGAGSALGASRAPPAPLEPCCFSPLAASSAGGFGAASEAAPVRPYPKTSSSEDQAVPCSKTSSRQSFVHLSFSIQMPPLIASSERKCTSIIFIAV